MKKRVILLISSLVVLLTSIFIIFLISFVNLITPENYSSAKNESQKFLERNYDNMEEIAIDLLSEEEEFSGRYKERYYSYDAKNDFVKFEIDSQGMLGGQYWSLVYTKDGTFWGESEKYVYEEIDGNNVIIAEKIDDHWWFYWIDYDGTDRSYK